GGDELRVDFGLAGPVAWRPPVAYVAHDAGDLLVVEHAREVRHVPVEDLRADPDRPVDAVQQDLRHHLAIRGDERRVRQWRDRAAHAGAVRLVAGGAIGLEQLLALAAGDGPAGGGT